MDSTANTPRHVAFIPDGNRRLAKRLLQNPWKGHEWGMQKMYRILEWSRGLGIQTFTFYALSIENLERRPQEELNFLFLLAQKELEDIISNKKHFVHMNRVKLTFFGRLALLPPALQETIKKVAEATKKYQGHMVNLALAYGGRQEIIDAVNSLLKKGISEADEAAFQNALSTNGYGDPDLIIRTGGEKRLSNFLPFQSVYAELAFTDTFWPEFSKEEYLALIRDFTNRERRFGK